MLPPEIEDIGGRRGRAVRSFAFAVAPGAVVTVPAGYEFEIGAGPVRVPLHWSSALTRAALLHDYLYTEWGAGWLRLADAIMLTWLAAQGWPRWRIAAVSLALCVWRFRSDTLAAQTVAAAMQAAPLPKRKPDD